MHADNSGIALSVFAIRDDLSQAGVRHGLTLQGRVRGSDLDMLSAPGW